MAWERFTPRDGCRETQRHSIKEQIVVYKHQAVSEAC